MTFRHHGNCFSRLRLDVSEDRGPHLFRAVVPVGIGMTLQAALTFVFRLVTDVTNEALDCVG